MATWNSKQQKKRINDIDYRNWKKEEVEKELWPWDLWIIPSRDRTGPHTNEYQGNFLPQIVYQTLMRYTCKRDWVLDVFAGSGTSLIECKRQMRNAIGVELVPKVAARANELIKMQKGPVFAKVIVGDSTSLTAKDQVKAILASHNVNKVQLLVFHPPYYNIIKFSNDDRDLSNAPSLEVFLQEFRSVVQNFAEFLEEERYLILVMGDYYAKGELVPLAFRSLDAVLNTGMFRLKGTVIKNIEGNRGKFGHERLWEYRALRGGFFIFKHEYIFVFQKKCGGAG